MKVEGPFQFDGEVIWLTPEQGGRSSGPPPFTDGYAQVAHVPPNNAENGSASFVLRGFEPGAWRSNAEGRWLVVGNEGAQRVEPGTVVMVTEGLRLVAVYRVTSVSS